MQFAQENNLPFTSVYVINDDLYIDVETKDEEKIIQALKNHKPKQEVNYRASALAKLAALGLTEDEIAAL